MSTTPTQQQIEEIAKQHRVLALKWGQVMRDNDFFKVEDEIVQALTEATQPLLERVKELEQVADIGDDLMNKQLERIDQLQSQLTTLEAACVERNEYITATNYWKLEPHDQKERAAYLKKFNDASSTSGQRILEENRRLREAINKVTWMLINHDNYGSVGDRQLAKELTDSISTNQLNQGK